MAKRAAILGVDTAAGAYLARLLDARGYRLSGTGGDALLADLGVVDAVARAATPAAAVAAVAAAEVYDLRDGVAGSADDRIAELVAAADGARIFVAVAPAADDARAAIAAARAQGHHIVAGTVGPHESRLGPGTTPVARIVAAVAAGHDPDPADLASSTDCGWTPEYVEPMWRMVHGPAGDHVIATGVPIDGAAAAGVAATWFERSAVRAPGAAVRAPGAAVRAPGAAGRSPRVESTAAPVLGWRAVTVGDELVKVLCEGAAAGHPHRVVNVRRRREVTRFPASSP